MHAQSPESKKKYRILIVDDHPMVRERLAQLVNEQPDMLTCVASADAALALTEIRQLQPDIVLVDLNLKGSSGLELIKNVHCEFPELLMLVVSMQEESVFAERVLHAGARGYINKEEATVRVITAIRTILGGGIWVSERMNAQLLGRLVGKRSAENSTALDRLSDREIEIFQMIGRGVGTRRIAEVLHVDPHTVETYRTRIKDKLGLTSSMEVLQRAVQWVQNDSTWQRTEAPSLKKSGPQNDTY